MIQNADNKIEKTVKLINLAMNNTEPREAESAFIKALSELKHNDIALKQVETSPYFDAFRKRLNAIDKEMREGKNRFGHITSAISGKIDYYLYSKKMTAEQIAKKCKCSKSRVTAHIARDLKKGMRSKNKVKCSVHTTSDNRLYLTLI